MKRVKPLPPELGAVLFRYLAIASRNGAVFSLVFDALGSDVQTFGQQHARVLKLLAAQAQPDVPLARVLAGQPGLVGESAVVLISHAETVGQLAPVLDALADDCQCLQAGQAAARGATAWPLQMGAVLLVLAALLSIFVVPSFEEVYRSFGAELPVLTRALLWACDFLQHIWWLAALVVVALVVVVRRRLLPRGVVDVLWHACGVLPSARAYLARQFGARVALWVAALGDHGTPLAVWVGVLVYLQDGSASPRVRRAAAALMARLQNGESLAAACQHIGMVPQSVTQALRLLDAGQQDTGVLALCQQLAQDQALRAGQRLGRHLFFGFYVVVGMCTALFVIALYLPIFKLGAIV